ncbi:MAG TPA: FG-GAP-like repeat-containing protein [Candidatus Hydrogenedentes bacterium]|nr:FG-GAP-like repeat-containing protein [Candidatus Hydrogenedentota bacterium]
MLKNVFLVTGFMLLGGFCGAQTLEWEFKTDSMPHSPTLFPNAEKPTGVVVAADNALSLVDGTGKALWTISLDKPIIAPATVADIDEDGHAEILVGLLDARVVCLDDTGKTKWTAPLTSGTVSVGISVVADVHPSKGLEIIVGRQDGWLYCLNARGETLWRFYGDPYRVGTPAVGDVNGDGFAEIVYGTDNGNIYCLNGMGGVVWRYTENAPYGRSGINLADRDCNGAAEVLVTRSNTGRYPCLMALDGRTGTFKWRTQDVMQSYISNATVDLDGDGKLETLHGDKGNYLYCTNADSSERWRVELGGHGIFWAPAVGDVNGDGKQEILVSMRQTDLVTGASHFLVSAEGKVLAPLKLGTNGNGASALGDIDGDGALEALMVTEKGITALTWGGSGAIAWPSLRGNSAMTANGNIPLGKPGLSNETEAPKAEISFDEVYCGENSMHVQWASPAPENAFAAITVQTKKHGGETRITPIPPGSNDAALSWCMPFREKASLTLTLASSNGGQVFGRAKLNVRPASPDTCNYQEVVTKCRQAITACPEGYSEGLAGQWMKLDAAQQAVAHPKGTTGLPEQATALRKQARELSTIAQSLETFWKAGNTGSFVYWPDANPWDTFDPDAMPETLAPSTPVHVTAFGDEFEDVALNLLNITSHAVEMRCVFSKPNLQGGNPTPEPALAKHISLRRGICVPTQKGNRTLDALPELDLSRCITLAPFETSQLWLVVDTHGLEAGIYAITLYLGTLEKPSTLREVPITIEVLPARLPEGVYAQINWSNFARETSSDQELKDMIDHGINVGYGPPLPTLPLDTDGNLSGPVDWQKVDAGLARVPAYFQFFYSSPPSVKWPENIKIEPGSTLENKGFSTAVRTMAKHFAEQGVGYDRWAYYPIDEPWITGFTNIPALKRFCTRVKAADPKARIYADPTGLLRVEYVSEFKDLIDIWQPEMNILKRDPELLAWFQQNAPTLWAYEATDPAKDLLPLGYYRGYAWLAWYLGLQGAGFWCYKAHDLWWPLEGTDWAVVYQTNDKVVPSRRWEACRDGQEDYRMLYLLREQIKKAHDAGRNANADHAETILKESVEKLVGWQARNIDEITRQTRPYELDYEELLACRYDLMKEIVLLKAMLGSIPP